VPKFIPTSTARNSITGDKIRMAGTVNRISRIRFEIGIDGNFPGRCIKRILPDVSW
jgi:hypothetical protein